MFFGKKRENELINKFPDWIIVNEHSNFKGKDSIFISQKYEIDTEIDFKNQNTKAIFYKKKQ